MTSFLYLTLTPLSSRALFQLNQVVSTITVYPSVAPPTRNSKNQFIFPDHKDFKPNLSPSEVLQRGSFGGTYFRPIYSSVTKTQYGPEVWQELPKDWLSGLDIKRQVASRTYDEAVNKWGVKCGGDLKMWEDSGWITEIDPYGWFQWYCRFFQGRRCSDDDRQLSRGLNCMGPKGRWRNNLINKVLASNKPLDQAVNDPSISPVVRQTLQHWGYELTVDDLQAAKKKK
jgi:hypothetical protein